MATWIYLIDCADALLLGIMLGPFFGIGLWVAHQLDLRKRVRKWANTVPVPDMDGSRVALTDAQARPGEAHGCYEEPPHVRAKRLAYVSRHGATDWERAAARECWEHFCAQEDAKRRAQ